MGVKPRRSGFQPAMSPTLVIPMTQLLCQLDTPDFPGWKRAFDQEAAGRMEAGLTLLQMWRDADTRSRVLLLFEVNDRHRAEAWLRKEQGFGGPMTAHFLETA